jgi:hypothetical protein
MNVDEALEAVKLISPKQGCALFKMKRKNQNRKIISTAIQILAVLIWGFLISPAIRSAFYLNVTNPRFSHVFRLGDIFIVLSEMFVTPGMYYAFLLSATPLDVSYDGILALSISAILFLPFFIWIFLKPERFKLLKILLQVSTILFILVFISTSIYFLLT